MVGNSCHFGCSDKESIHHLFFSCSLVKAAWFGHFSLSPPLHLQTNELLSWLKSTLFSFKDNENLLKGIIIFLNEIWRKRNFSAHGGRIPSPQDIIRDCNSTLSFSLLALRTKEISSSTLPPPSRLEVNISSQWHVLVKRWILHRQFYCRILICLNGSLAQVFTWQRTFTPGHLFALGCFRLALN